MPFELDQFIRTRPVLYHLTRRSNAERIQRMQRMQTAVEILTLAGRPEWFRQRRRESVVVGVNGDSVHLRDQAPLHKGNVGLHEGWSFEDLVLYLNNHVFFWPGTAKGPIEYGRRHFARYAGEDNAILVFQTSELFTSNVDKGPRFCAFNSGSPRCTDGRKSPRGPATFQSHSETGCTPGRVIEVTFAHEVSLVGCTIDVRSPHEFLSQT